MDRDEEELSHRNTAPLRVACRASVKDKPSEGLRIIVTRRVANVITVIISTESGTDFQYAAVYVVHHMRRFTTVVQKLLN